MLVAGVGNPWLGDLDFGPQFVRRGRAAAWPPGVALLEAPLAAHRLVHEIQIASPETLFLVAGYPRGEPPGTIRRYRAQVRRFDVTDVEARLVESVAGVIDLDHVLAVGNHYGVFPEETVVFEVEAIEQRFGFPFSAPVEAAVNVVRARLCEEIAQAPRSGTGQRARRR